MKLRFHGAERDLGEPHGHYGKNATPIWYYQMPRNGTKYLVKRKGRTGFATSLVAQDLATLTLTKDAPDAAIAFAHKRVLAQFKTSTHTVERAKQNALAWREFIQWLRSGDNEFDTDSTINGRKFDMPWGIHRFARGRAWVQAQVPRDREIRLGGGDYEAVTYGQLLDDVRDGKAVRVGRTFAYGLDRVAAMEAARGKLRRNDARRDKHEKVLAKLRARFSSKIVFPVINFDK